MTTERISAADLENVMASALARSGANPAMAKATARALAAAECEGIASHGASRIPQYCGHLRNGRTLLRITRGLALDHGRLGKITSRQRRTGHIRQP